MIRISKKWLIALCIIVILAIGGNMFFNYMLTIGNVYPATPNTSFGCIYDNRTNTLKVKHVGGNTISEENVQGGTEKMIIRHTGPDGFNRTIHWYDDTLSEKPIKEGDEITINRFYKDDIIEVLWYPKDPPPKEPKLYRFISCKGRNESYG